MAKAQKGFVVYGDIEAVVEELTDDQVGKLFRGMISYFSTGKAPKFDGVLKYVWIPIRQQMDRDKEKYEAKCEKNREKIQKYWDSVKSDTNEYNGIQTYTTATNTNTKTNTDTKTKTKTDTTTTTKTKARGGGADSDDLFNIWKRLTPADVDKIYDVYPESADYLIQEVYEEVISKKKKVDHPVQYILGYARKVNWDDKADHFVPPWEAM